ncbi:Heat stress transcription factor b-3 [Thalictrum thalictroides]|uniref:Heat stress transcription factor b-3 n=1 Tax=Thalictrum thalictroides TaxID=46969 RepID=A0A7J6WX18_THATH|nr:Heat stress transcription factor b-3 [Thalictrum thalictroides]
MSHDQFDKELLEYVIKKSSPPPFLLKTYMLVEDPATDVVISWNADGTAFVVWHIDEFSRDLLPSLFKHSNFSSFVRQLNTYGFRKISTSRWEFYNEMFRKGERELLCNIRRRKAWEHKLVRSNTPIQMTMVPKENDVDQESSSTSSSSSSRSRSNSLLEENKRLKRENEVLTSELTSMKNKCNELLKLVAVNTNMEQQDDTNMNHDQSPMLFGVRLNVSSMSKTIRPVEIN